LNAEGKTNDQQEQIQQGCFVAEDEVDDLLHSLYLLDAPIAFRKNLNRAINGP
jgi:hypothetical protein